MFLSLSSLIEFQFSTLFLTTLLLAAAAAFVQGFTLNKVKSARDRWKKASPWES
jgi:hypothetical protein